MKIGILGAGSIGRQLGHLWAQKDHQIQYGVRDESSPNTQEALLYTGNGARVGSFKEAAQFADILVLAVPWLAVSEVLPQCGQMEDKILIDCTNRFSAAAAGEEVSAALTVARMVPGVRVVKAFNTIGAEMLNEPVLEGRRITAFLCGDDREAKEVVGQLADQIGLDALDAGPLENSIYVEAMGVLWVRLAQNYSRHIGYRLLRR